MKLTINRQNYTGREVAGSQFVHYRVVDRSTKQTIIDGMGKAERVIDLMKVMYGGKTPTTKSQNNMTCFAIHRSPVVNDMTVIVSVFDTRVKASDAEAESHVIYGRPDPTIKKKYVDDWIESMDLQEPLKAIMHVLTINQDTFINSYMKKIYVQYPELEGILT